MTEKDFQYVGIPFLAGGSSPDGVDCRGLVALWLRNEMGIEIPRAGPAAFPTAELGRFSNSGRQAQRGDLIFFVHTASNQVRHVGICLGDDRILHSFRGSGSRIENGTTLIARLGFRPHCIVPAHQAPEVAAALNSSQVGAVGLIVQLVVAVVMALAASALAPKPKLGRTANRNGRYSDQSMVTQVSPEVPLPDIHGRILTAGNAVYSELQDKDSAVLSSSKWNRIVVLASGPIDGVETDTGLFVNGVSVRSRVWKDTTNNTGFAIDPTQDYDNAHLGTINGDSEVPNLTIYPGDQGITVPVDVRAQYDRSFPLHGLAGCSYIVFRLIDATKFQSFNISAKIRGRKCRSFNTSGFITTTATGESLTGADGSKVRFKLAQSDINAVSAVTVNGVSHTLMTATNQTGNVYHLNRTKGFIEFITAPAAAATVLATYSYYSRAWTRNPASQLVYLLTEAGRGKGYDASKIDWTAAVALRDACDEEVSWVAGDQVYYGPRYSCDYALDYRKPIQEHIRAVLDTCYGYLFLSNGKFTMKARGAASSLFSFTEANILADSLSAELVDRGDRSNRLRILFHGEDSLNAETEVVVEDRADQESRSTRVGNGGVVEENLKFPGVTSRLQAERIGHTLLQEEMHRTWVVTMTTNIQGLALEPGDLVDITHGSQPTWSAKLFRVEELGYDSEDRLQLTLSEYFAGSYI